VRERVRTASVCVREREYERPVCLCVCDSTHGTVTGPVVTPAESHAMLVKFSLENTVKRHGRVEVLGLGLRA
jgi:hypothetical protein